MSSRGQGSFRAELRFFVECSWAAAKIVLAAGSCSSWHV
ncbi:hypothetical protein KC19_7G094900 [Ceratodon purpureus]|uniref:Uncharacterized protein n=1 Tax=Ceratodon purpureus TaxID=3225 RepID=A0A8T0HCS3_CERPU|nr:hypothetical protein KC19_7G094900 [Ceratodon purpureus]